MKSHIRSLLLAVTIAFTLEGTAWCHGIPLNISAYNTNQLYATSLVSYDANESKLTANDADIRGAAGFYPTAGVFPAGRALTIDSSGSPFHPTSLLYWDGSNVLSSPVDITLQRTGINVTIHPTDTFVPVGTLPVFSGVQGGHSALNLILPLGAPNGLYALGFQVTSPGSPDFGRSNTFWGVANLGVAPENVPLGLAAIQTAVPEPSSAVLMVLGTLALLAFHWRRRS